jgi:hypothetical protein
MYNPCTTLETESIRSLLVRSEFPQYAQKISIIIPIVHRFKMQVQKFLPVLSTIAFAQAQVAALAPSPSTLSTTQSGVLPIAPTPFPGLETIEGAITHDGPIIEGFTGGFCTLNMPIRPLSLKQFLVRTRRECFYSEWQRSSNIPSSSAKHQL